MEKKLLFIMLGNMVISYANAIGVIVYMEK